MQLQLPFLTLTNSYLALLTHSFWPGEGSGSVAPAEMKGAQAISHVPTGTPTRTLPLPLPLP